ncbi:hypothetical protein MHYMCMPSP_01023 [Hyalomma marginatum]|uniref:Uncharacterized protein n=1 Tax=Hyalomma marginatum TaxID=34627 RepID=A0A8S4C181_9ACAR|nr:hypothetical protein MHYMCMPSP_01023 [Hyalomma marginatum]CAG7597403.1 hypothetical protein MHYMCMPASI_00935 [Hyalomma marginatum]
MFTSIKVNLCHRILLEQVMGSPLESRLMKDALSQIADWIKANPKEVLFLET